MKVPVATAALTLAVAGTAVQVHATVGEAAVPPTPVAADAALIPAGLLDDAQRTVRSAHRLRAAALRRAADRARARLIARQRARAAAARAAQERAAAAARASRAAVRVAAPTGHWAAVAACESGSNPAENTGNGFYGEYQFTEQTWLANGGGAYASRPDLAPAADQLIVAKRVLRSQGVGAWPVCGPRAGLTIADAA